MADCVVHEAASATGTKTPEYATKHKGRANRPKLYLKNITAAFQTDFLSKQSGRSAGIFSWMQAAGSGQTHA
jgi:hypothetical protein